jgi:hypothetical protein
MPYVNIYLMNELIRVEKRAMYIIFPKIDSTGEGGGRSYS